MKVWLGAAAALSGAGTLVYLLVRSSQRGRGNGTPGKASETQTARDNTQDTSTKKDGSCERLNGHLCSEEHTDSAAGVPDSAPCHTESKQHLSESTLTPGETRDTSASVERLSSNLDENLSELVSAIQEKVIVKEDNVSNTSTCEEVNERPHKDNKEISQPRPERDEETREHSSTRAIKEQTVVASDKKELQSTSNPETISSDTDISSVEGTSCVSSTTETSSSVPVPVVEELSQCRILRPQCDPCCHEEGGGCYHTTSTVPCESKQSSDENDATLQTEESAQKISQQEDSGTPSESLYTLDCSVSGKLNPDPPTNEPPLTDTHTEEQERGPELNRDEPETCIVTIEQRAKVYAEQMPSDPLSSGVGEMTPIGNAEGSLVALQTDSKVEEPLDSTTLPTQITVQEQGNKEEDAAQKQSEKKLEYPQEQRRSISEQEQNAKEQELSSKEQLDPEEGQSSYMQQGALQEQEINASEQDKDSDEQKCTDKEQLTPKEEKQEEKQGHDKEKIQTETQEQSESKQELALQREEANQENQSSGVQEATLETKEEVVESQEQNSSRSEAEQTPRQSDKKQEGKSSKEHRVPVEAKQSDSNKQAVTDQKQEPKGAEKQRESDRKQKGSQQEQSKQKEGAQKQRESNRKQEGAQKQKESDKKQKTAQNEAKSTNKQDQDIQKQEEMHNKQEEQSRKQEGAQKQRESNKKQKTAQNEAKSTNKQDTEIQKEETDNKQEEQSRKKEESNKSQGTALREVKSTKKDDTKMQKPEESANKKEVTQQEDQLREKEVTKQQKESEKTQRKTQKESKSPNKQDTESDSKQDVTVKEEQKSPEEGKSPERSAKDQVTGDSTAHSPSRCNNNNNSRKGTARSRGDSASADLDCDLGSEQDNLNCDSSSLKSMDSGQGSSEIEPETLFVQSTYPVTNQEQYIFYDFEIPQMLVGRLIGRKGAFINKIKAATEATVIVHPHKNRKLKLCSVEGTKHQVNAALEMIREHFPESQYPDITLQQVSSQHQSQPVMQPTLNAPSMQIELTTGVVVEVRVSAVVSGGELWVQQPLHPSYSALHRLQTCMNLNYGDGSNTPPLPNPISDGTVCVANIKDHWMRCQVLSSLNSMSLVLPLDVGGTVSLPSSSLRQIRYDYMTLPFQATQCFLHGLQPVDGDTWSDIAASVMEELVRGVILFAVVVSYTEDYVPLVNLYRRDQDHFVLLNEKMVELGHAQWISPQPSS